MAFPLQKIVLNFIFYLFGKALSGISVIIFSFEKGTSVKRIGGLMFCGQKQFVEDCVAALDQELPKYDVALQQEITQRRGRLLFMDQVEKTDWAVNRFFRVKSKKTLHLSYFSAGFFGIPEVYWKHGPDAICPLVIFRYFQACELGTGIRAACKYSDDRWRRECLARAKQRMQTWLTDVQYPIRWSKMYFPADAQPAPAAQG